MNKKRIHATNLRDMIQEAIENEIEYGLNARVKDYYEASWRARSEHLPDDVNPNTSLAYEVEVEVYNTDDDSLSETHHYFILFENYYNSVRLIHNSSF